MLNLEQQLDYLTLKFECLGIEDDRTDKADKEEEKSKWETQFLQYFGFIDEKLLDRMFYFAKSEKWEGKKQSIEKKK